MHAYWKMDDGQNEADRHDQLHEEYGACGGTLDVLAATASVADESGDRVAAHGMCGRAWENRG